MSETSTQKRHLRQGIHIVAAMSEPVFFRRPPVHSPSKLTHPREKPSSKKNGNTFIQPHPAGCLRPAARASAPLRVRPFSPRGFTETLRQGFQSGCTLRRLLRHQLDLGTDRRPKTEKGVETETTRVPKNIHRNFQTSGSESNGHVSFDLYWCCFEGDWELSGALLGGSKPSFPRASFCSRCLLHPFAKLETSLEALGRLVNSDLEQPIFAKHGEFLHPRFDCGKAERNYIEEFEHSEL